MTTTLDELYGSKVTQRFDFIIEQSATENDIGDVIVSRAAVRAAKNLLCELKQYDATVSRPSITRTATGAVSMYWTNGTLIHVLPGGKSFSLNQRNCGQSVIRVDAPERLQLICQTLRTPYDKSTTPSL